MAESITVDNHSIPEFLSTGKRLHATRTFAGNACRHVIPSDILDSQDILRSTLR